MASPTQPNAFTFGVEIEILVRPKEHIVEEMEKPFHNDAEDQSYHGKRRNRIRIAIHQALTSYFNQAGVEAKTDYDEEDQEWREWTMTPDVSIRFVKFRMIVS